MIDGILGAMQANQGCRVGESYGEAREKFDPLHHKIHSGLLFTNMCLTLKTTYKMLLI